MTGSTERETILSAALLWARNHLDEGVSDVRPQVLPILDRVLADGPRPNIRGFLNMYVPKTHSPRAEPPTSNKPHPQWEYRIIEFNHRPDYFGPMTDILRDLGTQGWRLIVAVPFEGQPFNHTLYLQREVRP